MGSTMNGMSVSGIVPAGGTFFVFSDYMRAAVRLAALSHYKTAFVWTHDSVGVGEDGPTHQPVEQLLSLRLMPGLRVIRPADANETAQAWRVHIDGTGPTAIVLGRQAVPVLEGTAERSLDGLPRGAYVLVDEGDRRARPRLRRHRFRGVGVRRRARGVGRRRRVRAGRVVPVVGPVRRAAATTTATPCSRRVCRRSPSKPA